MSDQALFLTNVSKSWLGTPILKSIEFTAYKGQLTVITGPSGSGKSTFCALAGLIEPADEGEVWLNQRRMDTESEKVRASTRANHIGFVFQRHLLLPYLSPRRNIELGMRYCGRSLDRHELSQSTKSLGIDSLLQQKTTTLSGGEAQRVAIARALISSPSVVIADEPTGNLDQQNSENVMQILRTVADNGVCVIVVSHDHNWLSAADRHIECRDGTLTETS